MAVLRPPPDGAAAAAAPSWPLPRYIGTRPPSQSGDVGDGGTTTGDGGDGGVPRSARTTDNSRRRYHHRPRHGARVSAVLGVGDAVAVADAALVAVGGAGACRKIRPCGFAVLPDDRTLHEHKNIILLVERNFKLLISIISIQ